MKKLFASGRDKLRAATRQQKVIPHRDVSDFVIDDDAPLIHECPGVRLASTGPPFPPRVLDMQSNEGKVTLRRSRSPYPQFAVPPISPSRSSSLASIPPVILPPRSSSPYSVTSHTTTPATPTPTSQTNPNPTHEDTLLVRPKQPSGDHCDWEVLSEPPVPSSPYPQFAVPSMSSSRSSSLASIPPVILPPRSSSPYSVTSHTTTPPTPTPTSQNNPNPTHTVRRDGRKIQKTQPIPAAIGVLKSLDLHLERALQQPHRHHVHEVPDDSFSVEHRDRAEKKERKSFWDGIIWDRDKDKERGRDEERETREKEKGREKDEEGRDRIWRKEYNPSELTRMIGYLTATSSEDWTLVLEVCERASATEANAKEAVKALRREFKYAEPKSQLSAARLWAIMRTNLVVRKQLMEVLAAAAFITSSRPNLSPFSPKNRDCDRDGFRALWMRLKPPDKPDVGIPFDTDVMFIPPIVRPPIEERLSRKSHQLGVIPPEEDMKRLFQECKIAKGYATFFSEMLAYATPEQIEGRLIHEFLMKCRESQELIYTQIPWASAGAERPRNKRERNAEGNRPTKSQPDIQFSSLPSRDYHGMDTNGDAEEQTLEEQLLDALLDADEVVSEALRMYDIVMRVVEERKAVEISSRDVKMDRRHIEMEYLGQFHRHYGEGFSRVPSPISPPTSCTPSPHASHMPSPPTSLRQLDLLPVVPSQTHVFRFFPAHSHYGPPSPHNNKTQVTCTLPSTQQVLRPASP
ncbi:hypothetical protein DFJ58DRAFT_886039 [Suillus subalutaceus]|uniref:uncharacterized protein n=1 Tax=Suillus subalutaceus TaxID=48586 RepID=UPI001B87866E|nr:uncharacterized protein DFJ58DRAFT_886039 [Suillus subalutaceus]KAG1851890.1 hypothetical protein DFJ58DRAFT_886039 [Suillus subalutaceus]